MVSCEFERQVAQVYMFPKTFIPAGLCKYSEPFPTWFSEEVSGDGVVSLVKPEMHQNSSSDFLQQSEALEVLAEGENPFPINLKDAFSTAGWVVQRLRYYSHYFYG